MLLSSRPDTPPSLGGAPNFRDLGGLDAGEGRRVRPGALLRSDRITDLGERDQLILAGLGVGDVCDLRSAEERSREPLRWPGDRRPTVHAVQDEPASVRGLAFDRLLELTADSHAAHAHMCQVYADLAVVYGPALGALLRRIDSGCGPVLIFCTAGKDRTGLMCALLLEAIGVPEAPIDADFLLSNERFGEPTLAGLRARGGKVPPAEAILVDPAYLRAARRRLTERFGSLTAFFDIHGADDALRARVRARITQ